MKFLILLLCLIGCEKSGTNESQIYRSVPSIKDGVSFQTLQEFILKPQCISCHGWVADESQVRMRVVQGNLNASTLYVQLASGKMPKGAGALSQQQLKLVEGYIMGAGTNVPPPIPLKPTFKSLKVHLFDKSCTMCHNDNSTRLDSFAHYETVVEESSDILSAIENYEMPPLDAEGNPKAPVPSEEVLAAFKEWIVIGMPEN
ncbi:MAG: hypothetical protein K2P81_05600 [Bacteriovoracaceae bacterium]|nr:hypothetical protein [Bacteriovoracaceae bacterium]